MKKLLSVVFILALLVSFSTQDRALANSKDELPKIMRTFSISLAK
ncbi:hypothetical protein [Sporosarcina quadrami]|nr:hypothetical protein [Sporosarcina quadrami]